MKTQILRPGISDAELETIAAFVTSQGLTGDSDAKALVHAVCSAPAIQRALRDSVLLDAIQEECWNIKFSRKQTSKGSEPELLIEVVAHHMVSPRNRVIGESSDDDLRAALEQAQRAGPNPPERPKE